MSHVLWRVEATDDAWWSLSPSDQEAMTQWLKEHEIGGLTVAVEILADGDGMVRCHVLDSRPMKVLADDSYASHIEWHSLRRMPPVWEPFNASRLP